MPADWKTSFKAAPWAKVLSLAPSIVDGAKNLWRKVASKDAPLLEPSVPLQEKVYSADTAVAAVEKQVQALELRTAKLRDEIGLSSEIIDKLAEQQAQLVHAVDVLRARTRTLQWVSGLLAVGILVLIYLAVGR